MLRALARRSPRAGELTDLSRALETILWTLMAASLLLVLAGVLQPEYSMRWLRIFVTIQVLSLTTIILSRRGFTRIAGLLLIVWLLLLVTEMAVTGGGLAAPVSFAYVIIVFIAGFLLGPRAEIVTALICIFTTLALAVIEITGYLPLTAVPYSPSTRWIGLTLFIVVVISLRYLATRTIRDALFQTRRELQDRKRAEAALEANEALLREFIKHTPAAIAMFDTNVRYLQTSDRWLTDYHQEGQDIIGKSHYEVVPDLPERWKMVHARALAGSVERCSEDSILRADGTREWLQWEVMPWRKVGGEIGGFILFTQDITERKQAEERINLLQMITMDVATAADIPSALEVVLRRVCEKTGWALGQAWIPRQDGPALECCSTCFASATGLDSFRAASKNITFPPGIGLPGRVWASRQPVWIRDVTLETNFPRDEVARASGLKAALGVPIPSGDDVVAVLEFFVREPRDEDERLVNLITAIAGQIGLVIERKRAEEALRWSEEQLRLLLDSTAEGVFGLDLEGRCTFCNASSLRLLGYDRPAELLGKDMHTLIAYNRPDGTPYPKEDCALMQSLLNGNPVFRDDEVFWRKDAISFPVECWSYPVLREGKHIGAVVTFLDMTERRQAEEELRATSEQLRALSERLRNAKEEEGIRIARELHDELGAALTTLKWSLLKLEKVKSTNTNKDGNFTEEIAEMVGLVDSTINTVRRISSELRPGVVDDLGLVSAIEWQAQQFQDNSGVVCRFESNAEEVDLNREQATTVFRIFQEAMTNILRHAHATTANILIEEEEGGFVLEIRDNGRGITETEKLGIRSLGLLGMRERAHSVGGTLEIIGAPEKGTVLTVRLPPQTTQGFEITREAVNTLSHKEKS